MSKAFEGLLSRYFETWLADVPTAAAAAGIRSAEGNLGNIGREFHVKRERERRKTLRELETLSPGDLTNEQQIDRLALSNLLLKESEDYARCRQEMEPSAPEFLLSALLRELLRGDEEPRRAAKNLRRLLDQAPDFLAEAAEVVRAPEPVWLRIMLEAVAGGTAMVEALRAFLALANPDTADESRLRSLGRALARYGSQMENRPITPKESFALGSAALQRRVREDLGLDFSLGQVEALALGEIGRVSALLRAACRRFGSRKRPADILEAARSAWVPEKPLLELYRSETSRIANAFRDSGAVTFPEGDELVVKPVPEFLGALIATAAYDQPGAFEKRQRGVFWVNDLGRRKTTPGEQLAERQQHFGLPLTCAHEAYPGHHLQFVMANRHPRKWRRLFAHAIYYEGWTLWCEQMAVDLRIDPAPWLELQQLHDALWRCHRILVDLRMHTGRYSWGQAARHLQRHLGFTRSRAEAEANWYSTQPGVPMSYWLGRLENQRLHRRLVQGRAWTLRQFNDWLLSFGAVPQSWIEKYGLD